MRMFAAGWAMLVLLLLATPAAAGKTLSASEIRALFPGTFEAVWKEKRRIRLDAGGDGVLVGGVGIVSHRGRWWTRGGELCISLAIWEEARCGRVVSQGGWYLSLIRKDGTPRLRFRRQ